MVDTSKFKSSILVMSGSVILVFVGVAHLVAFLNVADGDASVSQSLLWKGMKNVAPISGTRHTVYDFYLANNWSVGILNIALGMLGLVLGKVLSGGIPRSVLLVFTLAAFAEFIVSILWNPVPPIVFLGLATVCYSVAASRGH